MKKSRGPTFPTGAVPASASRRAICLPALLAVTLAMVVLGAFRALFHQRLPFLPFAIAVLVPCRWCGGRGGIIATIASALVLRFWVLPAPASVLDERVLGLGLFVVAGALASWQTSPRP